MSGKDEILSGWLLDEMALLSMDEVCRMCRVQREWLMELVDEGILEPRRGSGGDWQFSGTSLRRVRTVWRLQRDLGINLAGAALALDLMEELESLRARLARTV